MSKHLQDLDYQFQTLTSAVTIVWDVEEGQTAQVALAHNATLSTPANIVPGHSYALIVVQDGAGGRTLAFSNDYLWPAGLAPILSTGPGDVDVFAFVVNAAGQLLGTHAANYS